MARNERRRKGSANKDLIVIILLVVIIFLLTIYILFSKIDSKDDIERKNFLSTALNIQAKLSYYVCEMEKDTFGLYTPNEILSGKIDTSKADDNDEKLDNDLDSSDNAIKDVDGNSIIGIIDTDKNYGTDEVPIYKVNLTDLQKVLNISVDEFEGIEWYVENGNLIKVGFGFSKPSWWNDNFDVLVIK